MMLSGRVSIAPKWLTEPEPHDIARWAGRRLAQQMMRTAAASGLVFDARDVTVSVSRDGLDPFDPAVTLVGEVDARPA